MIRISFEPGVSQYVTLLPMMSAKYAARRSKFNDIPAYETVKATRKPTEQATWVSTTHRREEEEEEEEEEEDPLTALAEAVTALRRLWRSNPHPLR